MLDSAARAGVIDPPNQDDSSERNEQENGVDDKLPALIQVGEENVDDDFVVLVHGITDPQWNFESRWTSWAPWVNKIAHTSEHGFKCYKYDIESDESPIFAPNGIENEALQLLDAVARWREQCIDADEPWRHKRVAFIALDIGGTILKRALAIASLNARKFGNLHDLVSAIIFINCPHRSLHMAQLEDNISELLALREPRPSGFIKKIQNLASSAHEANCSFVESKLLVTTDITNIVSRSLKNEPVSAVRDKEQDSEDEELEPPENQNISDPNTEEGPDKEYMSHRPQQPCFMFDIPFERVYDCQMEHQKIVPGRVNDDDNIYTPEALDRLASHIKAVQDHRFETEHDAECFGWFLSQAPPLYPSAPVLTNKQIESIPQSDQFIHWSKQVTPSFLHLHAPSGVSEVSRQLAQHLNSARLLDNTREYRLTGEIVYFEINDEDITCSQMESMIAYFITVMIARFAFKGMNHLQRMYHQRSWTLHDLLKTFHLIRIGLDSDVFFAVGRLDLCDENSQRLFLRHMKLLTEGFRLRASMIVTTQGSTESRSKHPENWLSLDIEEVAAEIEASSQPQKKPSQFNPLSDKAAKALSFISHALRPLSTNELFCLMHLDDGTEITRASYSEVSEIVQEINDLSSHTVSLQDNRLEIVGPRDMGNEAACHERIFSALLSYLRRPLIQQQIFELCQPYETLLDVANSHPREDLTSYAVMYWPIHFRLSRSKKCLEETCEFLSDHSVVRTWSEGFRFLSNPITRTDLCYLSPIPLASMLGLEDALSWFLGKLRGSSTFQSDCELALIEAAQHGHITVAHQLMKAIDIDNFTLGDAISATASYGDFDLLHELVLLASKRDKFEWPSDLLLRISTIGDHKTAEILLNAGMPVNPSNPFQGRSPLHLAALNEHGELVRVLLDRKADVECRAQFGRIALATAAYGLAPRSIIKMLINAGSKIEAEDEDGCTPVQLAIMGGNLPAAEELLAEGADFERGLVEGSNSTANKKPLIMCAEDDQLEGTELLLRYKPDVNCLWNKVTPLWIAVNNGNVELCRLLLKHGANPDLNPIGYDMILLRAVEQSSLEIVELLVQNGADIEQEDNSSPWRRTALARAAGNPNEKILKFLLNSEPKADIMHVGEESQTPLFVAGVEEKIENARALLDAGADPSVPTGESRWLPIHAGYESPEMIQLFLENGCDINSEYANGNLLSLVVSQNREESARFLLTQSPVPNLEIEMADVTYNEDDKGLTPLSYSCGTNKHKLTRWLLRVGANTNHRTLFGRLPIDLAVATGSKQALKVLLEYGVTVSASDDEGNAVLHRITEATTRSMVRMLVNAGASVTAENKKGETPLQTAVTASNTPAVHILLSRGADPDQCSKEFYSLLHIACKNRDIQTLKALIKGGANVRRADTLRDAPSLAHAVLNYWDHSGTDPMPALLSYLVEECKCNISNQGGIGDLPLNTACYFNFIPQVQYLLSQGAKPDSEDCYGRRALHLASLYPGIKMLDMILDSGADALNGEDPVLDKLGRTPVHFAAVSGNWEVFKAISEIYDEKELHRPDGEGWTPLFWAVFNRETPIDIVQHLVDHGADLWVTVNDVKSEFKFSPLRLGRYIGVREEILELLVPNPPSRLIASTGQEEKWNDNDHTSRKAEERPKVCDSCRVGIFGIFYSCRVCNKQELCFRCYISRSLFHPHAEDSDWVDIGPEFSEPEEAQVENNSQSENSVQEDDSLPQNAAGEHSSRPSHNDGETETVADSVALSDDISSEISDDNDD